MMRDIAVRRSKPKDTPERHMQPEIPRKADPAMYLYGVFRDFARGRGTMCLRNMRRALEIGERVWRVLRRVERRRGIFTRRLHSLHANPIVGGAVTQTLIDSDRLAELHPLLEMSKR